MLFEVGLLLLVVVLWDMDGMFVDIEFYWIVEEYWLVE